MMQKTRKMLSRIFLQGLMVILPITITVSLLFWLAATAESFLGGLVQSIFPDWNYWTGLGTLLGIALVFVIGLMMNAWITRRILARAEAVMDRIPVVKSVYGGLRDLGKFLSGENSQINFHQVVAVSVAGMRLVGFVTRQDFTNLPPPLSTTQDMIGVYLPMSYQIGGYTVYVPKSAVEALDMTIEDAMRFTLTAGMSNADKSKE
jgi:uncharacterized membrane protein